MTSAKLIASNRRNAKRSKGPTSSDGKRRSSHNALRHGLSAVAYHAATFTKEAEQMVKAICAGDSDPFVIEQATVIADSQLTLRMIRDQKIAAIERLHDPLEVAIVKGDKRVAAAKAAFQQGRIAYYELSQLMHKLIKQGTHFYASFQPEKFGPNEPAWRYEPLTPRDEHEAVSEALPDLERLLRYERRALSRQRRAVLALAGHKLSRRIKRAAAATVTEPEGY
jgi:hypothetical protein